MLTTIVLFVLGSAFLIGGAEALVRGASRLAVAAGVTPLVVGLTVVAFGTSSPELAVTVASAYSGQADVAVGNVVGSNIFNVLFILGLSALIAPLVVAQQLIRLDVPLMIGASILTTLVVLDGRVGRLDGCLLAAAIVAYTVFLIRHSRRESQHVGGEYEEAFDGHAARQTPWWVNAGWIVAGLTLLVLGSQWLIRAAVETATALGVSERIIGLTIVATGTSLPELATSAMASVRGERDIAVGNVVGSNLFNLLAVLGFGALVAPRGIPVAAGTLAFDLPVMVAVAVACLPVFVTGYCIARWEGFVFLAYYFIYTLFLVLEATQHHLLSTLRDAMAFFVLPLTLLTFTVVTIRWWRGSRAGG